MMKLSTKGRYATRIMVRLAMQPGDAPARKHDIATGEGISADYVEQILMKLKTAGLVKSHRGARGGFTLARPPDQISVADVLRATEGPLELAPCNRSDCERSTVCVTQPLWSRAVGLLAELFSRTTVSELAEQAVRIRRAQAIDFHI